MKMKIKNKGIEFLRNSKDINGLRELKRVIYRPDVSTPTKSAAPSSASSSTSASHHTAASPMLSNGHSQGYTNGYHGSGHSTHASRTIVPLVIVPFSSPVVP